MFGSDWPVCRLAADYGDVLRTMRDLVGGTDHEAVFGGTATEVYKLRRR